jgi:exodeoxyribonuclease-5
LNGGIWHVKSTAPTRKKRLALNIVPEDDPARKPLRIGVLPEFFQGLEESLSPTIRRESDEFAYGYALTVHKAQGSQWNHVVLFDESFAFREHRSRWLYTGITRAAERLTIVV